MSDSIVEGLRALKELTAEIRALADEIVVSKEAKQKARGTDDV
jgi:hypothetical protein